MEERKPISTKDIPFRTLVELLDALEHLRDKLEKLGRVKRGALECDSKNKVWKAVTSFVVYISNCIRDEKLELLIENMVLIATIIRDASSSDNGGYTKIEKNVAMLFYQIGFIKGI